MDVTLITILGGKVLVWSISQFLNSARCRCWNCNQDDLTKPFAISEYYKTIIIIGGGVEPIADNLAGSSVRPSFHWYWWDSTAWPGRKVTTVTSCQVGITVASHRAPSDTLLHCSSIVAKHLWWKSYWRSGFRYCIGYIEEVTDCHERPMLDYVQLLKLWVIRETL